jgi:hypothetical protein
MSLMIACRIAVAYFHWKAWARSKKAQHAMLQRFPIVATLSTLGTLGLLLFFLLASLVTGSR